ncbi:MAG: hypothetical protein RI949_385 [Pseudomonadota bacterium]
MFPEAHALSARNAPIPRPSIVECMKEPASSVSRLVFPAATGQPQREWAARLPFEVVLGPYRLSAELRERSAMMDGRRRTCLNLESNRIELRQDLSGLRLASAFLESLIRLCHFSKGCQQGCVEESYAHSLATGLVEFAQRNPAAWLWFNLLISQHLPGRVAHDRVARGAITAPPPMPKRVRLGPQSVGVRVISRASCGNAFGWYDLTRQEVQLCEGLLGTHLPIVALHEITHAIHHVWGLDDHDLHDDFLHAQQAGWMGLIKVNPTAWRWLVWTMSFPSRSLALQCG